MKAIAATTLLLIALPVSSAAWAQEARPLPPGSYQDDRNRSGLREFEPPSPVTVITPPPDYKEKAPQQAPSPRPAAPPPQKPGPIIG